MRDHQCRQMLFGDDLIGDFQHLGRCLRVESGCRFIEKKDVRLFHGRHEQRESLALPAGKKSDAGAEAILQTEIQTGHHVSVFLMISCGKSPFQTAALPSSGREQKIFFDLHAGRSAFQRILENAADILRSLVFADAGDVRAIDFDRPCIGNIRAGDGIKKRTLARAVAADDGTKITVIQSERQTIQCFLFIAGALEEGFADVGNF